MGYLQDYSKPNAHILWTPSEKAKQQRLREDIDKEYKIIKDAKNILIKEIGIEINSFQPILYQLVEVV